MAYYLRQDKKKKGIYLQMYETYWDKEKKQPRSRDIESFGIEESFRITKSYLDARLFMYKKRNNLRTFFNLIP